MIRHTAAEALFVNAIPADERSRRIIAKSPRQSRLAEGSGRDRASIAALVKIACSASNSATLRTTACECLGERIASAPELTSFAARALFAKRDTGTDPEFVFDALLCIIREAAPTSGNLFYDAVEALCDERKGVRIAAAKRMIRALHRLQPPAPRLVVLNTSFFETRGVAQRA